jgi:hypothetical protein
VTTLFNLSPGDVHEPGGMAAPKRTTTPTVAMMDLAMKAATNRAQRRAEARAVRKKAVAEAVARPKRMRGRKGLRMTITSADGTRHEIRHMSDDQADGLMLLPGCEIADTELVHTMAATAASNRVWIQLAQVGAFKGHPSGAFEFSPAVFSNIVQNFDRDGLPIPIDAEHASEMKPTDGSIPSEGAPAMGWIHGLDNRGNKGLWGHVEWLEPARTYIKEGRYKFISPAVRFKSKDRKSGADTGPRLSSAGLTNTPFLPDMKPLTARLEGEHVYVMSLVAAESVAAVDGDEAVTMSSLCYSTNEYMPRIRNLLGLHSLTTAKACADHLATLREHFDAAGGDPSKTHQGIRLSDYVMPMRHLVGAQMGSTWDDVFDAMQDLIDVAIDEHEIAYHGEPDAKAATMSEAAQVPPAIPEALPLPAEPTESPGPAPAEPNVTEPETAAVPTPTTESITMTTPAIPTVAAPAPAAPAAAPIVAESTVVGSAEVGTLTLKLRGAEAENRRLKDEVTTLRAWKEEREDTDLADEVMAAYDTYSEAKSLKPDDRMAMLSWLRSDPEGFRTMYPAVPNAQRHLLRNIAGGNSDPQKPGTRVPADKANPFGDQPQLLSVRELAHQISRKRGISLGQAQVEAQRIVRKQRAAV